MSADVTGLYTMADELAFIAGMGSFSPNRRKSPQRRIQQLRSYLTHAERRVWPANIDRGKCIAAAREALEALGVTDEVAA